MDKAMRIRVLIADDHDLFRAGLKEIFKLKTEIFCKDEASNGEQVLRLLRKDKYDLLLLDMTMAGLSGIELIKQVRILDANLPILVLSMHEVAQLAFHAIKAGANGYITKGSKPEKLFDAIRKVAGGGKYMDPHLSEELAFSNALAQQAMPHHLLSGREFEIFRLLAEGKSNHDISGLLLISEKTVSTYKSRILGKMDFNSVADIVRYAMQHHIIGEITP